MGPCLSFTCSYLSPSSCQFIEVIPLICLIKTQLLSIQHTCSHLLKALEGAQSSHEELEQCIPSSFLKMLYLFREERSFCLRALECVEKDIINVSGSAPSIIEQINGSVVGLCRPRTESNPCTIYPIVEPTHFFVASTGSFVCADEQGL